MKKAISFLIVLSALVITANTQVLPTGSLKGTVLNLTDNTPFSQVNVAAYTLPDTTLAGGSVTQSDGTFSIKDLPFGKYQVRIRYVGYKPYETDFTLSSTQTQFDAGTIGLSESAENLQGVEVVGVKPGIIFQSDKKILNVAQLKQTGATTLIEVLENAPGITTDAEGNVLLRGSSNYVVLVDGKQSPVAGTSLLRQLPADMVENIEIMTNPSAKYEAAGAAGIINLILKKTKTGGFNGQATVTAGWNNKYIGDWQMGYRKNKINLFAGVSANYIQTRADGTISRTLFDSLQTVNRNSILIQEVNIKSLNFNAGMDYDINKNNSVSLSGRFGKMSQNVNIINQISLLVSDSPIKNWLLYTNGLSLDGGYFNPQFNFRHKFDTLGQTLDFDVFAGVFSGELNQLLQENPSDSLYNPENQFNTRSQSLTYLDIKDIRIKIDYVKPFASGNKIEAGAQVNLNNDQSDFHYQDYDLLTSGWVDNPLYTNNFILYRNIIAGYGIWSGKVKKLSYSLGIRSEFTDQRIDQRTINEEYKTSYLDFFPSGSASIELPKSQSVQFSFSRRINRPAGIQLNPFPQFIDNLTIQLGNPDLLPEYIQSYELSFQKQTKLGLVSAQGYYRDVKNVVSIALLKDSLDRISLTSMNANRSHSAGIELNGNIQAAKWLMLMANANLYYYTLLDPGMSDEIKNSIFSWTARLNTVFLFGPNTRFVISNNYTGPSVMLQGRQGGRFLMNLGLTQTMMKRKASLTLGVRDLLRTNRTLLETYSEGLTVVTSIRGESPMVTLTFTYNINNYKQRQEEEQMDLNFVR
ncbi:MAG: outer membrane beta-barrel family protein [Bacteroidota bacterium]